MSSFEIKEATVRRGVRDNTKTVSFLIRGAKGKYKVRVKQFGYVNLHETLKESLFDVEIFEDNTWERKTLMDLECHPEKKHAGPRVKITDLPPEAA